MAIQKSPLPIYLLQVSRVTLTRSLTCKGKRCDPGVFFGHRLPASSFEMNHNWVVPWCIPPTYFSSGYGNEVRRGDNDRNPVHVPRSTVRCKTLRRYLSVYPLETSR